MVNGIGRIALGIDIGTSSVKATAITESGRVLTASSAAYPTAIPFDGAAEQDPDDWWSALQTAAGDVLRTLLTEGAGISPATTTIGLTGQMHTSVLLGPDRGLVHPAMLWSDKRATAECREIREQLPGFAEITGNVPMPAFTVAHLLWLRRHRPEAARKVASVLNPKDEIRRRLGAGHATEPADASGTGMFDTRRGQWSETILQALDLEPAWLAPVIDSHAVSGTVSGAAPHATALTGLLAGVPVVGGGGDQAAQAVALGVTKDGRVGLSLGTSGVVFAALAEPRRGCFRHSYEGLWLALDSTHAAGLSLAWLAQLTGCGVPELTSSTAGPEDSPLFLPYLQGQRDSLSAEQVPGAFVGLQAHHSRAQLAYAAMEGVAFELVRLAETMGVAGPRAGDAAGEPLYLGGGGGRSERWRSLIASAFGRPVCFADRDSSFGAAQLAAEAAGWADEFAAADHSRPVVAEPELDLAERRARFEELRSSLAGNR